MIGDAAEAAATGYLAGGPGASGGRACSTVARPNSRCSRQKEGKKQAEVGENQAGEEVSAWSEDTGLFLVGRESGTWLKQAR